MQPYAQAGSEITLYVAEREPTNPGELVLYISPEHQLPREMVPKSGTFSMRILVYGFPNADVQVSVSWYGQTSPEVFNTRLGPDGTWRQVVAIPVANALSVVNIQARSGSQVAENEYGS